MASKECKTASFCIVRPHDRKTNGLFLQITFNKKPLLIRNSLSPYKTGYF